jgi:hypothetical protein
MKKTAEERDAASFAKLLVLMCMRNTFLEDLHAGKVPVSKTGDYSDVKVIDGTGREIPWLELSRFDDAEMKRLMKECADKVYTLLVLMDSGGFNQLANKWRGSTVGWSMPELDKSFMRTLELCEG